VTCCGMRQRWRRRAGWTWRRSRRRTCAAPATAIPASTPSLSAGICQSSTPATRPVSAFPRRLVVAVAERVLPSGRRAAALTLVSAEANAFPDGPVSIGGKLAGYRVGAVLGDPLTDNTRRVDAYRFHNAVHLGFMAVLGWSPVMRALLRLKRKSSREADECEDGARAIFAEEGLAAMLSRLGRSRTGFLSATSIDGDVIEVAKAAAADLEAEAVPGWLWRAAIHQGFCAMYLLGENGGGYLVADLDARELAYRKVLAS
jgi:MazG C-terminal domain